MKLRPSPRRRVSAQEQLPLEEITGDIVRLRGGESRAVLQAGCVNFALKADSEQEAILAGYRRFLNSLSYSLQILVRVVPTDIDAYLAGIERNDEQRSDTLRRLARDHAAFVRRIARDRTLLDRRFYVIVPAGIRTTTRAALVWPWRRAATREQQHLSVLADRRQLTFRCAEIAQGLAAFGVSAHRLEEDELAALWRATLAGTPPTPLARDRHAAPAVTTPTRWEVAHA